MPGKRDETSKAIEALEKAQKALDGVAEMYGISEEDVVEMCREVRREIYTERYADPH